jgi:hypothetical protein
LTGETVWLKCLREGENESSVLNLVTN